VKDIRYKGGIPYEEGDPSHLKRVRTKVKQQVKKRKRLEEKQKGASDVNAVWHEADAMRVLSQPGTSEEARKKATELLKKSRKDFK